MTRRINRRGASSYGSGDNRKGYFSHGPTLHFIVGKSGWICRLPTSRGSCCGCFKAVLSRVPGPCGSSEGGPMTINHMRDIDVGLQLPGRSAQAKQNGGLLIIAPLGENGC